MAITIYWACNDESWLRAKTPDSIYKNFVQNHKNQKNNLVLCPATKDYMSQFNPVNFSKNVTKTISAVEEKIGKVTAVPQTLTDQLNAKTGINIAAPPLPPINANVKGLVGSVKTLVKNPNGVVKDGITAASGAARTKLTNVAINTLGGAIGGAVTGDGVRGSVGGFVRGGAASIKGAVVSTVGGAKSTVSGLVSGSSIQNGVTGAVGAVGGFAKASFGVATVAVRGSLSQIKGTLRLGIKNCLRSAVSSLLSNISTPNIPFGGITPNIPNGVSVNGVITSVGAAGAIELAVPAPPAGIIADAISLSYLPI